MNINYENVQKSLNEYGKYVLSCIKKENGSSLSQEQLQTLDRLLSTDFIVVEQPNKKDIEFFSNQAGITDPKEFSVEYVPSAHGGRTKGDNKIHIYPYTKAFSDCKTENELLNDCVDNIVTHEIFHYFIRPNLYDEEGTIREEFGHFLTEGLVQHYAETFSQNHKLPTPKSNYDRNVAFVKELLAGLPDNLSKEQVDRIVFSYNQNDLLNASKNGKQLYDRFVEDIQFKNDVSSFIISIGENLGMDRNDKKLSGIISHYKKATDKKIVIADLQRNVEILFKDDKETKDKLMKDLDDIVPSKENKDKRTDNLDKKFKKVDTPKKLVLKPQKKEKQNKKFKAISKQKNPINSKFKIINKTQQNDIGLENAHDMQIDNASLDHSQSGPTLSK